MNDKQLLRRAWDALDTFKQAYPENWHEEDQQVLDDLIKADVTQPEQTTEFKYQNYGWWRDESGELKLGTMPESKKKWVALTDEEIEEIKRNYKSVGNAVLWTEAKLKEKNT